MECRIHLLVPRASGRIKSDGGPAFSPQLQTLLGQQTIGVAGSYVIACEPTLHMDGMRERGTDQAVAVSCPRCQQTREFLELAQPTMTPPVPAVQPEDCGKC